MKDFKVCLHLEETILAAVKPMVEKSFVLVDESANCDIFLTDVYTIRKPDSVNILIAEYSKLPAFKGVSGLIGFDHYVIYSELGFLEERVRKALLRHSQILGGKSEATTGVNALISLEPTTTDNGMTLPLVEQFKITSSRERKDMADGLEKFFDRIEATSGFKSPVAVQYAIEIQEELLMNAIWDANPKNAKEPRSKPVELLPGEEVYLQWAFNGKELAISVSDPFGRMNPNVMERYVNFIFKTGKTIEHTMNSTEKVSAGLGMYMVIQRANLLSVFISDGKITDVGVVLIIKAGKRSTTITSKAIDIIKVQ